MATLLGITLIFGAIALWCWIGRWRSRAHTVSKVVWTLILILPIVGPLFYGGLFESPPALPGDLKRMDNWCADQCCSSLQDDE